jgi:zinc protease
MRAYRFLFAFMAVLLLVAPARADIREVTSRGGIKAWLVEDKSLPLVSLTLSFEGGSALDPAGKEGRATLLAAMLDEGAGELDSKAFQSALAERSISLSFAADEDSLGGVLKTLSSEKANAFALLRLALHSPRFDVDALSRMRDSLIANRQMNLSDPDWIAGQAFEQVAMGTHPYGRAAEGTLTSLRALGRDDLLAAKTQHLVRSRLKIAVVGDMTASELAVVLDQVFADLPQGPDKVDLLRLQLDGAGTTTLVRRDQPQTVIMAGMPGLLREDPDWFTALIANYVLGGDFQSRLMNEVRIKRGLTYGINTALVPYRAGGVLYAMASSDNAKVAEVLQLLRAELGKMSKAGITDSELNEAKTYLTGSFALRFSSSDRIASVLLEIQRLGLPPSYVFNRAKEIDKVTRADVARVAEQLMQPDKLTVVIVGNPEGIEATRTMSVDP